MGALLLTRQVSLAVFNYWEPLHYLTRGQGFQTWEHSPDYAIRSYFYLALHVLPDRLGTRVISWDKVSSFDKFIYGSQLTIGWRSVEASLLSPAPHFCHCILAVRNDPIQIRRRQHFPSSGTISLLWSLVLRRTVCCLHCVSAVNVCHVGGHALYGCQSLSCR